MDLTCLPTLDRLFLPFVVCNPCDVVRSVVTPTPPPTAIAPGQLPYGPAFSRCEVTEVFRSGGGDTEAQTDYLFDDEGRLREVERYVAGEAYDRTVFGYSGDSMTSRQTDGDFDGTTDLEVTMDYEAGRLVRLATFQRPSCVQLAVASFDYRTDGQIVQHVVTDTLRGKMVLRERFTYDNIGFRRHAIVDGDGDGATDSIDLHLWTNNLLTHVVGYECPQELRGVETYEYDLSGRRIRLAVDIGGDGVIEQEYGWHYVERPSGLSIVEEYTVLGVREHVTTSEYDELGRLRRIQHDGHSASFVDEFSYRCSTPPGALPRRDPPAVPR